MAYIDCDYKGSIAYNTVMSASRYNLECRKPYTINAIAYHTKEGNAGQIKFFEDDLKLIDKRLKLKSTV